MAAAVQSLHLCLRQKGKGWHVSVCPLVVRKREAFSDHLGSCLITRLFLCVNKGDKSIWHFSLCHSEVGLASDGQSALSVFANKVGVTTGDILNGTNPVLCQR